MRRPKSPGFALVVLVTVLATTPGVDLSIDVTSVSASRVAAPDHRPRAAVFVYPFGQLSVGKSGTLYYVDRQFGQIDEVTKSGSHIVLSSLKGTASPSGSIKGLRGLSVTKDAIWFTAAGNLYEASLSGHRVRQVGSAPGARHLDVLGNGTIYFTTVTSVFERIRGRVMTHVAGGTTIDFVEQQHGPQPAVDEAINPTDVLGVNSDAFYFTNENNLYFVEHGKSTMLRPRQDFFNGELASGPHGALFGICDWSICRITGSRFKGLFNLRTRINGSFAAPDALAVSPTGTFYISYSNQSTPLKTGIAEFSPSGHLLAIVASRINK
ncbi:MAG: hypothetical protein WCF24_04790 [Acidimicrobiales bacterium]